MARSKSNHRRSKKQHDERYHSSTNTRVRTDEDHSPSVSSNELIETNEQTIKRLQRTLIDELSIDQIPQQLASENQPMMELDAIENEAMNLLHSTQSAAENHPSELDLTDITPAQQDLLALARSIDQQCQASQEDQIASRELPQNSCPSPSVNAIENDRFVLFEQQVERVIERMERQFERFFQRLESTLHDVQWSKLDSPSQSSNHEEEPLKSKPSSSSAALPDNTPSSQSWEHQKRKMLLELGVAEEELEQISLSSASVSPSVGTLKSSEADGNRIGQFDLCSVPRTGVDAIYDSIAKLEDIAVDSEIIDQLKEQLTSKLREAEVELSISRAKLSQEWANLEQRQSELRQQESALNSKYKGGDAAVRPGLLDRFTRHLSKKSGRDQ